MSTVPADTPTTLVVYNTLTRSKEVFEPLRAGRVGMYVCGVTPYDDAHIGHGMFAIVFDMIRRYLMHIGFDVVYVQNFTDIDDKIIAQANATEQPPDAITARLIAAWDAERAALNILPATRSPRATGEIPEIVALILDLIDRGHAYEVGGDVYFAVRSFPDYGKLSRRNVDDLLSGARIEIGERKRDPLDFALWKTAKPGEPQWESPWSDGRPGWHIECSAMCSHHLDGLVDMHGGGRDLMFPHHENEIAQSEAAGIVPFARYWLHNGMLQLNGEKMSKSVGNVIKLADLVDADHSAAFRLQVLQTHYRSPINFTWEGLNAAATGLSRIRAALAATTPHHNDEPIDELDVTQDRSARDFHTAMHDDFDTPGAIAAVFDLARAVNRAMATQSSSPSIRSAQATLRELIEILGIDLQVQETESDAGPFIDLLIDVRRRLRAAQQFDLADAIRDDLHERGISIEDKPGGTIWKRR